MYWRTSLILRCIAVGKKLANQLARELSSASSCHGSLFDLVTKYWPNQCFRGY